MEMQGELRTLSSKSKWIVAKGSPHWIQIHRPELVAAEVQEIVNAARGTAHFKLTNTRNTSSEVIRHESSQSSQENSHEDVIPVCGPSAGRNAFRGAPLHP